MITDISWKSANFGFESVGLFISFRTSLILSCSVLVKVLNFIPNELLVKKASNLYYISSGITPKRVTSGEGRLNG